MKKDLDAEDKLRTARAKASFLRPYFSHALYSLVLVQSESCPTMAVDEHKRLYFNPVFVHAMSIPELATVFLHELGHVLRDHHDRARTLGVTQRTFGIANIAQDCELNDDLRDELAELKDLPPLPPPRHRPDLLKKFPEKQLGPFYPWKIDCPDNEVWEVYYSALIEQHLAAFSMPSANPNDDDGEGGFEIPADCDGAVIADNCGSGAHGVRQPWEDGDPTSSGVEGVSPADWSDVKRLTAQDVLKVKKSRGTVPGGWEEWAEEILRPPRIPWDVELAGGLRWAISHVAGHVFHSYCRPSRRQSAYKRIVFPVMRKPLPFICAIGDTSGSMDRQDLALVRGTVEDICHAMSARVAFLATDAEVHGGVQMVHGARQMRLLGRGGTNMAVGIEYAMTKLKPRPDVIVVITDCETPWPSERPAARVIVCAVGEAPRVDAIPSWARVIHVHPDELRNAA